MTDVKIRMRADGPIVVEGPFRLVDSAGNEFLIDGSKPGCALCRCGQSARKPFCDGAHKDCSFVSDERAPIDS